MAELRSLDELSQSLVRAADLIDAELEIYLKHLMNAVVTRARNALGDYHAAFGPFNAWAPLKESTKRIRVEMGYTPNDPLLRSGAMHDATYGILQNDGAGRWTVTVGSTADYAWRQELGDGKITPRPFLGPALLYECEHIEDELSELVYRCFVEAFE